MLLEELSQRLPYNSEAESLDGALPQFGEFNVPLTPPQCPASPIWWFGKQAPVNPWHLSLDKLPQPNTPKTPIPSTPWWEYQSTGLNSGMKTQNCYPRLMTTSSFESTQSYQMLSQDELDCYINPWYKLEESTDTDAPYKENVIYPGGGSRESDVHKRCKRIRTESSGIQAIPSRNHAHNNCTENVYYKQAKQSHNEASVYRQNKSGVGETYERQNNFSRSRRKFYSSGISGKDLKRFAKFIGFKTCKDRTHTYICELLDYVIDSKQVYRASKCPRGSKFLQHQIMNANEADRNDILLQVMEKLVKICNENYGNYVVQSFFMLKKPAIEQEILLRMKGSLCVVAMNQYGCRVLQKAITTISDELLHIMIDALAPNALMLAVHNFGCHVLQCAIDRGTGWVVRVLFLSAMGWRSSNRLVELSKNSFGCRIVKRMLEKAFSEDKVTIIDAIMGSHRDLRDLCMDEFGNYVVQHIVNNFRVQYSMAVVDVLDGKLLKMAKNKFCSNVIEILYKRGGREVQNRLMQQVDLNFVKECLNDKFANFFIQTMLTEGEQENRDKIRLLLQIIPNLRKLKYGHFVNHRLYKLKRFLAKMD